MRRIVFIAPSLKVVLICCFMPCLLLADCAANDSGRSSCGGSPDAGAANIIGCAMVVLPKPDAGSADRAAASDEVVEPKHDAASLLDTDNDADGPELPDVADDVEDESPYRDAASAVPPCPILATACDPVGNILCPSPVLNCYLTDVATTVCACPTGDSNDSAPCRIYSDCLPGLACVADVSGAITRHCHATCYGSNPKCPIAGTSCLPIIAGAKLGYCG